MTADDRDRARTGDLDVRLASDPLADPFLLARIAEERPDLHAALAGNPACPVHVLQWLRSLRSMEIDQALQRNATAVTMGIVKAARPTVPAPTTAPASGWQAPPAGAQLPAPTGVVTAPAEPSAPPTVAMPVAAVPPPTVALPMVVADPTPTAALRPTVPPPPDEDDEPRRRGFLLIAALIPLLFIGGCFAAVALARDDGGGRVRGDASGSVTTVVVLPTQLTAASVPTTAAAPPTDGATAPTTPSTPATTEAPATDAPASAAPPTPSPTPSPTTVRATATTVRSPATTARATTTTRAPTTTIRTAAVSPTTVAAASVQSFSYTVAQQFASALAAGDWSRVRALSPASKETDAQFQAVYGNLDASTVVPVKATSRTATSYALRIGIVAHETNNGVKQTSLYCAHWDVDTAAGTVTRVDGTKLRTESGTKAASGYTAELNKTCASVALA